MTLDEIWRHLELSFWRLCVSALGDGQLAAHMMHCRVDVLECWGDGGGIEDVSQRVTGVSSFNHRELSQVPFWFHFGPILVPSENCYGPTGTSGGVLVDLLLYWMTCKNTNLIEISK